jgi:hypothetical protein
MTVSGGAHGKVPLNCPNKEHMSCFRYKYGNHVIIYINCWKYDKIVINYISSRISTVLLSFTRARLAFVSSVIYNGYALSLT